MNFYQKTNMKRPHCSQSFIIKEDIGGDELIGRVLIVVRQLCYVITFNSLFMLMLL